MKEKTEKTEKAFGFTITQKASRNFFTWREQGKREGNHTVIENGSRKTQVGKPNKTAR
jgi:hypothetical protein